MTELPIYYFVAISGAISLVALFISFHVFKLKAESLLLAFAGIHTIVTALSPQLWNLVSNMEAASEVLYGTNIALGAIIFFSMIGGAKMLESDVESILLGYIAAYALSVAGASILVTGVAGIV